MKLTIGEKWHREETEYIEEMTIEGLASIEDQLPNGEVVLPKNGDSKVKVRIINSVTANFFTTEVKLRAIVNNWERGEAPIEMPGMLV
jgi:hypothetical protein